MAMGSGEPSSPKPNGMPRWLVWGIAIKLVLVTSIVVAVVWWANR